VLDSRCGKRFTGLGHGSLGRLPSINFSFGPGQAGLLDSVYAGGISPLSARLGVETTNLGIPEHVVRHQAEFPVAPRCNRQVDRGVFVGLLKFDRVPFSSYFIHLAHNLRVARRKANSCAVAQ